MFDRRSSSFISRIGPLVAVLAWFSAVFAGYSFGQAEPPKAPSEQATSINVNEVSLDMVVRDKKGKLVSDLKPEDFSVTDGGTAVKISSLRLVSGDGGDHFVTMVFDRMDSAAGHNAREIAAKMLTLVPQTGFSFCVMKAGSRLLLYQNFTSDHVSLNNAVAQAVSDEPGTSNGAVEAEKSLITLARSGSGDPANPVPSSQRIAARALLAALQESHRVLEELHTQPGLAGLMAVARAEQRIPLRKVVIYFTPGLSEDSSSKDRLRDIVGVANRAGVSIYVVSTNALSPQADQSLLAMMAMGNARSVAAQTPAQPAFATSPSGVRQAVPQQAPGLAPMIGNQMDRFEVGDPDSMKSPLTILSEGTGGVYVSAGENLKKPLKRMIAEMTTYYEAAYTTPVETFDGQFRPIAVKPVRAGLKISSRAGYFALPPDSGNAIRAFEAPLLKILDQSQLPSDVELHAKLLQLGDMPAGNENSIVVEIPVSALKTRDDPNTNLYSLHAAVVAQIKNKAGTVIEHFGEDIPRHGALDAKNAAQAEAITMQRHFTAEPGEYLLEAAVFDYQSGETGAQRLTFNIPRPTAGPSLSDVAMVGRIDPVPEEADPTEPMRYGSSKVVPSAMEQIEEGRKNLSFFFVVHPDADSSEQPSLEMEIRKSGEAITQLPLALHKTSEASSVPYLASIQAAGLPSGDYEVIERLSQGGRTAERSVSFRIAGADGSAEGTAAKDGSEVPGPEAALPTGGQKGHGLIITSLPSTDVSAPSPDQLQAIISRARKRALDYGRALPNFMCVEVTNRSVDSAGNGNWKHRDSIAELLTYHDSAESRTTLEVNGVRSSLKRTEMNSTWPISVGEFGAVLNLLFSPSSKTAFEWKESASLGDGSGTVQVLSYRVARENATIVLRHGNDQLGVGFHGLVYLDATTGGVRRVTIQADGLPASFAYHSAAMTVDYEYVAIAGRDYLLPVHSTVTLQRGRRQLELNEIGFRNYRRFASRTKIKVLQ